MKNEEMLKYEQNREEIARLEKIQNEADVAFNKIKAEYEANKEELSGALNFLKRQNHKIAEENYTFSLGEIWEETKNVAKSYGCSNPVAEVYINATIWNTGKLRRLAKSVEDCRKWLENVDNKFYFNNAAIYVAVENENFVNTKEYRVMFTKKLNFDMLMCNGSKLIDNLYSQVDFDDVQGCYNTRLFLKKSAYNNFPVIIDPTNFPRLQSDAFNNEFIAEVFENLMAKRQQEVEAGENNR